MTITGQRGDPLDHQDVRLDDFVEGMDRTGAPYSGHVVAVDRTPWDTCITVHEVGDGGATERRHWASVDPWRRVDLDREWGLFTASGLLRQRGFADAAVAKQAAAVWRDWGWPTPETHELCPMHRDIPRASCQRPSHDFR